MTQRIYIAGPMRGHKHFNFPAFAEAAKTLSSDGYTVVSPAQMDIEAGFDPYALPDDYDWQDLDIIGFSLRDAVIRDVSAIVNCDAMYMLRGWESSRGARAERALAEWIGLEVLEERPEDILDEAARVTRGDRQAAYGPPDQDFRRTAAMWSALKGVAFSARDVAMFMIALKLSREIHQKKRDNAVDIAGYARCLSICQECESMETHQ